jgi:hypothetical protein
MPRLWYSREDSCRAFVGRGEVVNKSRMMSSASRHEALARRAQGLSSRDQSVRTAKIVLKDSGTLQGVI